MLTSLVVGRPGALDRPEPLKWPRSFISAVNIGTFSTYTMLTVNEVEFINRYGSQQSFFEADTHFREAPATRV